MSTVKLTPAEERVVDLIRNLGEFEKIEIKFEVRKDGRKILTIIKFSTLKETFAQPVD